MNSYHKQLLSTYSGVKNPLKMLTYFNKLRFFANFCLALGTHKSLVAAILITAGILSTESQAKQYASEARVVNEAEANRTPPKVEDVARNPEPVLKSLSDNPYAKSLVLQQLAAHAVGGKNDTKAIKYYEEIIKLKSLTSQALQPVRLALAQLYYKNKQYKKSVSTLRAYFSRGGAATADAWLLQGSAYIKMNKHRLAKKPLQSALETLDGGKDISKKEDLYKLLLAVYYKTKDHKAAINHLSKMVRHFPNNVDYWTQLSALHYKQKNKAEALAVIELAHRSGVLTEQDQYLRFARLLMNSGAPFFGAELLESWFADGKVTETAGLRDLVTQAWTAAREDKRAISSLRQALDLQTTGSRYLQLGQLLVQQRQWAQAVDALNKAIRNGGLKKSIGPAWINIALAHYELKNLSEARNAFAQARKYRSVAAIAKQWLSYLDSIDRYGLLASKIAAKADAQKAQENNSVSSGGLFTQQHGLFDGADEEVHSTEVENSGSANNQLTPIGAEQAANADGSIPEWLGGFDLDSVRGGHYERDGSLKDLYANDKPLYTINKDNWLEYRSLLSEGHKQLLQQNNNYYLNVYPTRRSARYPQAIYDASIANEKTAKLVGSDSLRDAKLGVPFRKPNTGAEVMWNHRVRYRGDNVQFKQRHMVVTAQGVSREVSTSNRVLFNYGNIKKPGKAGKKNILLYYLGLGSNYGQKGLALAHDTVDHMDGARKIWVRSPTGANLIRVPPVGYDFPTPASDGIAYIDQIDMYNGAFDRYDWRILGKRDLIIPYNAYKINSSSLPYSAFVKAEHPDQAKMRYEKHRVWVVEAAKRKGASHHFRKRIFYVDEDSWSVALVDNYNATNTLWKFQEGHVLTQHEVKAVVMMPQIVYDLIADRYFITGLTNEETAPVYNDDKLSKKSFSTAAARRLLR